MVLGTAVFSSTKHGEYGVQIALCLASTDFGTEYGRFFKTCVGNSLVKPWCCMRIFEKGACSKALQLTLFKVRIITDNLSGLPALNILSHKSDFRYNIMPGRTRDFIPCGMHKFTTSD